MNDLVLSLSILLGAVLVIGALLTWLELNAEKKTKSH